jgi:hypothetical protein
VVHPLAAGKCSARICSIFPRGIECPIERAYHLYAGGVADIWQETKDNAFGFGNIITLTWDIEPIGVSICPQLEARLCTLTAPRRSSDVVLDEKLLLRWIQKFEQLWYMSGSLEHRHCDEGLHAQREAPQG